MTTKSKTENAVALAKASSELIHTIKRFRDAQHSVMFQMSNPSLSFMYEFKKSGDEMERCRIALYDIMQKVDDLAFDVLMDNKRKEKSE